MKKHTFAVTVAALVAFNSVTSAATVPTHTWFRPGTILYIGASIAPADGSCSWQDWEWNAGNYLRQIPLPEVGTEPAKFKLVTEVPWEALVSAPDRNFTYYLGKDVGKECIFGTTVRFVAVVQSDKVFAPADIEWGYLTKNGWGWLDEHNFSGKGVADGTAVGVKDLRFVSPKGCAYKVYSKYSVTDVEEWAKTCPILVLWYRVTSKTGVVLGEARLDIPVGDPKPRAYSLGFMKGEKPGEAILDVWGYPNQSYWLWSAQKVEGPWSKGMFPVQTGLYLYEGKQEFFRLAP